MHCKADITEDQFAIAFGAGREVTCREVIDFDF